MLKIIGIGAVILALGAGIYVAINMPAANTGDSSISKEAVQEFTDQMRAGTIARVGQPIEGFEPTMFMQAFPGLTANDFNNVDALIGLYRYQNGEAVYDLNGEIETHSAARAISDEGMLTLLLNIADRLNYDLTGNETVADVLAAISAAPGEDPTNPAAGGGIEPTLFGTKVTFKGSIVCLPHKGDGPHTMECAYGLKADNGSHYALKNLFNEPGPWEFDVSDRIEVTGMLAEPAANEKYDIVGVIDVQTKRGI